MDNVSIIRQWVLEKLEEPDFQSYFLLQVQVQTGNKVEVYLDGDQGIDLAACRSISRFLEERLDADGPLGDHYSLEVSSPGATKPLALPRQFPKHQGRTLELTLKDESKTSGRLLRTDETGILLEVALPGKGRNKTFEEQRFLFADIKEATVKIAFK